MHRFADCRKTRKAHVPWKSGPSELALSLPKGRRKSHQINAGFKPLWSSVACQLDFFRNVFSDAVSAAESVRLQPLWGRYAAENQFFRKLLTLWEEICL